MKKLLMTSLAVVLLVGCAPTNNMYYWGNYSVSLYDFKKDEDEKTLQAHRDQLLIIMKESASQNKRVPPGVNAEYGYYLLKEGKEAEGLEYFDKEMALYPECHVLLEKLKSEYARGKK